MPTAPQASRPPRRRRGWLAAAAGVLLGVPLLAALLALLALASLDRPAVKARLEALAGRAAGLPVSWDALGIALDGTVRLEGLRVGQPGPWAGRGPDLLRAGRVAGRILPGALLAGRLEVPSLQAEGLHLTVLQDASGRTSLEDLSPPGEGAAATPPAAPRSRALAWTGPPTVLDLRLAAAGATLVRLQPEGPPATDTLAGLDLHLQARAAEGVLDARLEAGPAGPGLAWTGTGPAPDPATAALRGSTLALAATVAVEASRTANLELDLGLATPREGSGLWPGALARLAARADLDPGAGRLRVQVPRLDLLDGFLAGTLAATLPDAPRDGTVASLEDLRLALDPARMPDPLRPSLAGLSLEGPGVTLEASSVAALDGGGFALRGPARLGLRLDRAAWTAEGRQGRAEGLEGEAELRLGGDGRLSLSGRLAVARAEGTVGEAGAGARGLVLAATLEDLPLADALAGRWAGTLDATLQADRLEGSLSGRGCALDGPSAGLQAQGSVADPDPGAWTGRGRLRVDLPGLAATLAVEAPPGDLAWSGTLEGALPPSCATRIPAGARRSLPRHLSARGQGTLARPAGDAPPAHRERWTLDLEGLGADLPAGRLDLPAVRLQGDTRGAGTAVEGSLQAEARRPALAGRLLASRLDARADLQQAPDGLRLGLEASLRAADALPGGPAALEGRGDLAWNPARRSISYRVSTTLRDASALRAALPPERDRDLGDLALQELSVRAQGRVDGWRTREGWPALPADPLASLRGEDRSEVSLRGLRLRRGETALDVPAARSTATLAARGDGVEARLSLDPVALDLRSGTHRVSLAGATLDLRARLPRADAFRRVVLDGTLRVAEARQDLLAAWPVRDAVLALEGEVSPRSLRLDRLLLDQPGGGTRLELKGDLEGGVPATLASAGPAGAPPGPRTLRLEGRLDQDLGRVDGDPGSFRGTGRLRCPFRLESGDGRRLRLSLAAEAEGVDLDLPRRGLSVRGARGTIPVLQEFDLRPDGRPALVPGPGIDPWARVRFHDLHPYLRGGWFAADEVRAGALQAGPLAGNLRMDRSVLSLDQMQAAWKGGTVAGQLLVDLGGDDVRVAFRGDVTGVQAGEDGRRLDANAALALSLRRQEVEGRVQLVSLGRGHLRDLLDLWDPAGEVVAANRVRSVLPYAYPRRARVRLDGGFLSARVDLGGLASVVRIDEIRGIPVGPLLRRFLPAAPPGGGKP